VTIGFRTQAIGKPYTSGYLPHARLDNDQFNKRTPETSLSLVFSSYRIQIPQPSSSLPEYSMSMAIVPKLFQPIKIGDLMLSHRVVLAPLTRFRANKVHVHGDLAVKYYVQRASAPGTLLISESTVISAKAGGYYHVPGIWNEEQVVSWKRVTDAVHAKDCRIFCQLLAQGRTADPHVLGPYNDNDDTTPFFAPSDIPIGDSPNRPIPLSISGMASNHTHGRFPHRVIS